MKINYILSDTTTTSTTKALQELTKKAENNLFDSYVVIVPETKSIAIEREILSLLKNHSTANIFVYSFVRLLSRVGKIAPEKVLNKQVSVMLLRKIISDNASKFVCYKKTARNVNFAEKIYDTIAQFKSSNVSPEDLLRGMNGYSSSLKSKLTDIILIYSEYEKTLGGELFDDSDKLSKLKEFAKTSTFVKESEFFVVGFDNITWQMQDVLKEITKNAKEITFSSVYFAENRVDKFIQSNELYKKFKRIAEELNYPYVPTFAKSYYSGDFFDIKENLFAFKKQKKESKGQVSVFVAKNKYQEIEFIANEIIKETKNGARFRDIAIISKNLAEDKDIFVKTFEKFGIPLFVSGDYDISSHPLLKFLSLAFELESSRFSADKVLEFLNNALVSPEGLFDFENFVNEYGIDYSLFLKEVDLSSQSSDKAEKIKNIFDLIADFHRKNKDELKNCVTIADFVKLIENILKEFNIEQKLEKFVIYQDELGLKEEAEITRVIFEKLTSFLQTLVNFLGTMEVGLSEFLQILMSGFSSFKINLTPLSTDCVILQSNSDGLFDIKSLYISSADENSFPVKINDSGIILDNELEEAKLGAGKDIEPTVSEINKRETYNSFETMLLPSNKLVLSYSQKALDGSAVNPSSLVVKLTLLFGDEIKSSSYSPEKFVSKKDAEKKFARNVNRFLNNEYLLVDLNEEYSLLFDSFSKRFLNAIESNEITQEITPLTNANELYFYGDKTSISQLEKYFSCPYKFFASYGLRLKDNKQAKMNSIDIGNFIHKVAELFTKKMKAFENLSDDELTNEISNITAQAEQVLNIRQNQNQSILGFLRKEVQRLCRYFLSEQSCSSFKNAPSKNEFSFAGDSAVVIELDGGRKIKIEGKIDRVDECFDYVRIIDYKTGDVASDLTSIYYGKKIQLISYLLALQKLGNKKIAGLFYFPIHSDFVKNDDNINEKYKMQGFLLDDIEVVKLMDCKLSFDNPSSSLVPIKIKVNKENKNLNIFELNKVGTKKYFSKDEFEVIKKYNEELYKLAMQEILSGYIEPSPLLAKSEDSLIQCQTCELSGFCGLAKSKFKNGRKCSDKVEMESFYKERNNGDKVD